MATDFSFGAIFARLAAVVDPSTPALIHGDRCVTWGEFDARTDAVAAHCLARGAQAGDRIAHLMRNSPAYLETTIAGFKARLVHVNINYRYTGEELFYILDNSDASVLVFDAEFAPLVDSIRDLLNVKVLLQVGGDTAPFAADFETVATSGAVLAAQDHRPDDMLFIYTGGTTGMPKGVMWDQSAIFGLIAAGTGVAAPADLDEHLENCRQGLGRNRALVLPPLMHGTGFIIGIATLCRGGTVVTLPGHHFDAELAVRTTMQHGCDYAVIVGDAFARPLLKALDAGAGTIASIATMISSGTMWSPEIKAGLLGHHPGLMIVDSWGSSEGLGLGASVQTAGNAGAATRFVADGKTLIVGEDLRAVQPGERGRVARGGLIPRGYWRDEAKTAATFVTVDGVRYSMPGDWAILEDDGSFTLLGRGSQCINTAGEKVFPEEVEEMLKTHPAIDDALVFGVPDDQWGQAVTAVVEAHGPVAEDELRAHVRQHLAGYKTPKRVVVVAKVPRAPNGKADYAGARALADAALQTA